MRCRLPECLAMRSKVLLLFLPCLIIFTLYFVYGKYADYDDFFPLKLSNDILSEGEILRFNQSTDVVDGYLVWNPKCHLISANPMDQSIRKFVKKYPYDSCAKTTLLSAIKKELNGTTFIEINPEARKHYDGFVCCWSAVERTKPKKPLGSDFDSKFHTGHCEDFEKRVQLPRDVETVLVSCRRKGHSKSVRSNTLYENIHAFVNPTKVQDRLNASQSAHNRSEGSRKLSVLVLGIDSVSRLNFLRSMPKTEQYLRDTGWHHFQGYNKMGDNTFPNLMAILTGQNSSTAYAKCKPTQAYGLDNCPFLWRNFKQAGYVTAYGEDYSSINTFNFLKVGFVDPPTDYYLRPVVLATEKLLTTRNKFGSLYCAGPRSSVERIFDYAVDLAKSFIGVPYFGFFWTNAVSHNDVNGVSSLDSHIRDMLQGLEQHGIFNDTMIIFLSDHGMRWGDIRRTLVGWYEERLPFLYLRVPEWFSQANDVTEALKINQHRLTSPFDLHETLRDVLKRSGGDPVPNTGCPACHSLFRPVPQVRSCDDAGITSHWCACADFAADNPKSEMAEHGAQTFVDYIETTVKNFKNKKGKRLCASLRVKKIHRFNRILNPSNDTVDSADSRNYFYLLETTPGNGLFEITINFDESGKARVTEEEVSRINSYDSDSRCINVHKKYCYCVH